MQLFYRVFLFVFVAVAMSAPPAGAEPLSQAESLQFEATCRHFENRARFKPRRPDAVLVVRLADSCRAALSAAQARAPQRKRNEIALSRAYLDRLTEFKSLYVRMMVQNGRSWHGAAKMRTPRVARLGLTETGEYLIARHMGLLGAFDDWASATGFRITLQD
ncbi:MAG: hypothetical protein QNJ16_08860 [Rhodobacter sp.]|nr:hypothetical protein [Rhodobacter sp.]